MRSYVFALTFGLAGISACSFLLDTGDLQKGGSAAASDGGTGVGGSGGGPGSDASTDAGSGTAMCVSDFDCQGVMFDGCKISHCQKGTCGPSEKYSGLGVNPEGDVTTVFEADDIGYPTLLADGTNFYLATWKQDGTTTNIDLRRFNESPGVGGASTDLVALAPNAYAQFGSSPGMVVVGLLGGRLRLLFAGAAGAAPMGMHVLDIDEAPFKLAPPLQQPIVDPGVAGYDAKPRGPVPQLITGNWGLWVQSDKLYYFDGITAATPVYTAKHVVGFAPMIGLGGPYAVLETTGATGQTNQATEMWANGNMSSLASLVGDEAGERRGVAVAPYPEILANVVVWSLVGKSGVSLKTNLAACVGTFCQAAGGDIKNSDDVPASLPEISSAKVAGTDHDRNFAETFQITLAQPNDPARATTVLIGSMIRVQATADAGLDAGTATNAVNPPNFMIATSDGPTSAAPGEVIGPSSVAITANGHVMTAWVERGPGGAQTHVLKIRRFAVATCP